LGEKVLLKLMEKSLSKCPVTNIWEVLVTEDGKSEKEVKARIGMTKGTFCRKFEELLKGNMNMTTWKRLLNCCVFSVLK